MSTQQALRGASPKFHAEPGVINAFSWPSVAEFWGNLDLGVRRCFRDCEREHGFAMSQ
jgi:hypothetical protein